MSEVSATIEIAASPDEIWAVIMDPDRFGDWVSIHRKLCSADSGPLREGFHVEQRLALRGAPFTVRWTLTEFEAPNLGTWEGKGPAGSYARVTNKLRANGNGGTHYEYENQFEAPGGMMGRVASRVLVGGMPKREADKSLQNLKRLLERKAH
jgi:carbon monoxide dehydrogenase subunit G